MTTLHGYGKGIVLTLVLSHATIRSAVLPCFHKPRCLPHSCTRCCGMVDESIAPTAPTSRRRRFLCPVARLRVPYPAGSMVKGSMFFR
jgi:hypothetical protein